MHDTNVQSFVLAIVRSLDLDGPRDELPDFDLTERVNRLNEWAAALPHSGVPGRKISEAQVESALLDLIRAGDLCVYWTSDDVMRIRATNIWRSE